MDSKGVGKGGKNILKFLDIFTLFEIQYKCNQRFRSLKSLAIRIAYSVSKWAISFYLSNFMDSRWATRLSL